MICKDCIVEMESADLIHFEEGRILNVQICPACGITCPDEGNAKVGELRK